MSGKGRRPLLGARRFTAASAAPAGVFDNEENLLIRGDNLPALECLWHRYRGAVSCIYIDPPYNTGNTGFCYNDRLERNAWLAFMRARLERAWRLLREDGFLFVQCDDTQSAYLKVLLDELFGEENFRNAIYWRRTYAGKTAAKKLPWNTDTILLYARSRAAALRTVTAELSARDIRTYRKDDGDGRGKYATVGLQKTSNPGPETTYDYIDNTGRIWRCPAKGWRMRREKLKALENDGRLYIAANSIREKYYLEERRKIGKQIDNFWHDIGNLNRVSDIPCGIDGQKPELLLRRCIALASGPGDLVLDFFLGSGTTCAAALKMGRRFLGVEQMRYLEEKTVPRLVEALKGEQGGISALEGWQGGGSFVYCALGEAGEKPSPTDAAFSDSFYTQIPDANLR